MMRICNPPVLSWMGPLSLKGPYPGKMSKDRKVATDVNDSDPVDEIVYVAYALDILFLWRVFDRQPPMLDFSAVMKHYFHLLHRLNCALFHFVHATSPRPESMAK